VFQANITGGFSSSVQRSWIGYSTIRNLSISAGTSHVVVGNDFNGKNANIGFPYIDYAIFLRDGTGNVKIANNVIRNYGTGYANQTAGMGLIIDPTVGLCFIANNVFSSICNGYNWNWNEGGTGIFIRGDRGIYNPVIIKGNIFEKLSEGSYSRYSHAVYGRFANVTMSDNAVHKYNGWISGMDNGDAGVVATNTTELSAPVSWEPSTFFKLPSASALKNKGPNDARFNNFDGTRNDLGIWGGTQFDPDGRTTTKPVVPF